MPSMEWSCVLFWTFVSMVIWFRFSFAEQLVVDFTVSRWAPCLTQREWSLTLSSVSVKQCVHECAARSECISLGYKSVLNVCQLHFENASEFREIHGPNHCIFIRRKDIITTEVENVCTCDDEHLCDVHTGQCIIKECRHMNLSNGKVYGNVRFVNAKVRVRCNSGYEEINGVVEATCNPDGSWSYTPTCVVHSSATTPNSVCNALDTWINHVSDPTFEVDISQELVKQGEASLACGNVSATLVKVDEEWKQKYLAETLANCSENSCYWIDGSFENTTWRFSDSSDMPTDSAVFWDTGEPNSAGGMTCVAINSNQRWINKNCNNACGFICEKV